MAKKSKKLEEIKNMVKELNINYEEIDLNVLNNFVTIAKKLDDRRVQYKIKHNMSDIVIIALLGILANANTWTEIYYFAVAHETWLKSFLELPSGIPSHDTIQRVVGLINPSTLYTSTVKYLINLINNLTVKSNEKDVKSIDGKTITITKGNDTSEELITQDTTYKDATITTSGLMSPTDKSKLDNINVPTKLSQLTDDVGYAKSVDVPKSVSY